MEFTTDYDQSGSRPLKHPGVTFFHLFFRFSALFLYFFGSFFSSTYIGVFVPVSLLLSLDFWTVKNITGRIMVRTLSRKVCYDSSVNVNTIMISNSMFLFPS